MLRAALFTLASAVAVPVTLAVPAGPAAAATLPTRYTTYEDVRLDVADYSGSLTITVGSNVHRVAKIKFVADCGGYEETYVRRNVPINDQGIFRFESGRYVSMVGTFRTKDRVTGSFTTGQCGFFGGDYAATD